MESFIYCCWHCDTINFQKEHEVVWVRLQAARNCDAIKEAYSHQVMVCACIYAIPLRMSARSECMDSVEQVADLDDR